MDDCQHNIFSSNGYNGCSYYTNSPAPSPPFEEISESSSSSRGVTIFVYAMVMVNVIFCLYTCYTAFGFFKKRPAAAAAARPDYSVLRRSRQLHHRHQQYGQLYQQYGRLHHQHYYPNYPSIRHHHHHHHGDGILTQIHRAQNAAEDAAVRAKVCRVVFAEQSFYSTITTNDLFEANTTHSTGGNDEENAITCSICIEPFQQGDTVSATLCKHSFHRDCILGWSQIRDDCPVCRQDMWDKVTFNMVEKEVIAIEEEAFHMVEQILGEEEARSLS